MRIKITLTWDEELLLVRYRAYQRSGIKTVSYMAEITGPHPDYILARSFVDRFRRRNLRWDSFTCYVEHDGIYEIVIKRLTEDGILLSRERKWLIVDGGLTSLYEDEQMNYASVLCRARLFRRRRMEHA